MFYVMRYMFCAFLACMYSIAVSGDGIAQNTIEDKQKQGRWCVQYRNDGWCCMNITQDRDNDMVQRFVQSNNDILEAFNKHMVLIGGLI